MSTPIPRAGQRFEAPLPADVGPWLVEIQRVRSGGAEADLRIWWAGLTWTMRVPLPLPASVTPSDWTAADIQAAKSVDMRLVVDTSLPEMSATTDGSEGEA